MTELYAGLMSGTSLDGIDAVLVSFDSSRRVDIIDSGFTPYSSGMREQLLALIDNPHQERTLIRQTEAELGELYADAVLQLSTGLRALRVRAIGCHGQTILHAPDAHPPFSWQIGSADALAKRTGMPVVSDFRRADLLHGGQGAPLAPAFHRYAFGDKDASIAVVNIGGIANVTHLPANHLDRVTGFDTGPGNALSDRWVQKCSGRAYDKGGVWASSAEPDEDLLTAFLQDDYFQVSPPKSLDTRFFSMNWLYGQLGAAQAELDAAVVQSTIAAFTAESIWLGIKRWMPPVERIIVCGGGAHNTAMLNRLKQRSGLMVTTSQSFGISPDDVEACAFAWLAMRRINGLSGNLPSVTGAAKSVLLGSITLPQQS